MSHIDLMIIGNDWKDQLLVHIYRPNNYVLTEYERTFKYADKIEFVSIEEEMLEKYKNGDYKSYSTFEEFMKETEFNQKERNPQFNKYGNFKWQYDYVQPIKIKEADFILVLKKEAKGSIIYEDKKSTGEDFYDHLQVKTASIKTRKVTQAFKKDIDIEKTTKEFPPFILYKGLFYDGSSIGSIHDEDGNIDFDLMKKQGDLWRAFYKETLNNCDENELITLLDVHS